MSDGEQIDLHETPNGVNINVELTAVYREVPGGFIAFVEELPGANTQGATLDEARANLREAVTLVLETNARWPKRT